MCSKTIPEHDLHNILFALDDIQQNTEALTTSLQQMNRSLAVLQDYLETLL